MVEYHRSEQPNNNHEEIAALYIFLDIESLLGSLRKIRNICLADFVEKVYKVSKDFSLFLNTKAQSHWFSLATSLFSLS